MKKHDQFILIGIETCQKIPCCRQQLNEKQLFDHVSRCKHPKNKFFGVFAADNFPIELPCGTFVIMNASSASSLGSHWLLFLNKEGDHIFVDPLGEPLEVYTTIYTRLMRGHWSVQQVARGISIQPKSSTLCGLYCIYIAHLLFKDSKIQYTIINDHQLLKFAHHML